jgi:photosystem II stability/assembly factor-like uncharacterized protein
MEQTSGVTVQLTSVSVPNILGNGWICGYSGTVLRTTNNGMNWANVSGNGIPATVQLINILGIDASMALTAGYIGTTTYVYRTTNGGSNWQQVFTEANGFIDAIGKIGSSNLFMCGDPVGGRWSLWKSSNSGANWDSTGLYLSQAGAEAGWNNAMFCTPTNRIWIGTNNTRLYYSSNGGNSWVIQPTGGELNSYALYFASNGDYNDGLMAGATMLRTSNGGLNWTPQTTIGTGNFGGITGENAIFDNPPQILTCYYVRSSTSIYSGFGGTNFTIAFTAPSGNYRYIGGNMLAGPFWAVRSNGGITYRAAQAGIISIGNEIPSSFSLHQNYPNLFNPSTAIRFDVPKSSYVELTVYNSLGSEIAKLINENLIAGSYEYKWDVPDRISSGIYYYKLETNGFLQTKKMILIK